MVKFFTTVYVCVLKVEKNKLLEENSAEGY